MMYSTTSSQQQSAVSTVAGCTTQVPNTPDVINSIISMMNPFDRYAGSPASEDSSGSCSPASPPRMQSICSSLLIKEELKLAIRSKQRNAIDQTAATSPASTVSAGSSTKKRRQCEESHGDDDDDEGVSSHGEGLTAEDEERRRRRRERNKIAATKCRLKKREKTVNLVQESEVLETKNYDLKTQIQELETQRNQLMKMLTVHPCAKRHQQQRQQQQQQQQEYANPATVSSPDLGHQVVGAYGATDPYGHQPQPQHQPQQPQLQVPPQPQLQQQQPQLPPQPQLQAQPQQQPHIPHLQHQSVTVTESLILKDAMFNGAEGDQHDIYSPGQPPYRTDLSQYTGATGYGCVDDVYSTFKDGLHDMAQYYDQGIC
ncbi:activating transcription factor 3 [Adelges cooleyi]|uniref:activating transcription factor 3 n=1 Tax=Adelges cooleyi TaxID=133065 RepID=UPI002180001E|nr:activating transcription factor 3 [Adelges cooleyi]XP_050423102.1 activating transcription factor 3 [Adelges cooleyi]